MEVLQSLGVNSTIFFQFVIFTLTFIAMMEIAFKPFAQSHEAREKNTKGSLDNVSKLQTEAAGLMKKYEDEARSATTEIRSIFDKQRDLARQEAEGFVTVARADAGQMLSMTRQKVETQIREATVKAKEEIPTIAQALIKKLLA